MYARVRSRFKGQMGYYTEPTFQKLLPDVPLTQRPPYTLVLSLEDLLIHSEWTREHGWRTAKRPGTDYFLRYLSQYYELVIFTSLPMAGADMVVRKLDPFRVVMWPLFREATRYEGGEYIKDLSYLNRPLDKTIIIDTKASHVKMQPENAILLPKWTGSPKDPHAPELVNLIPFLEYIASMGIEDTRKALESFAGKDIPTEFARREAEARAKHNAQLAAERARAPRNSIGGLLTNALGVKPGQGMVMSDGEESVAEGLAKGKMMSDLVRERGRREYERMEREIRENGEKWLKEMEEEEKKQMEIAQKEMKKSWFGFSGRPSASAPPSSSSSSAVGPAA
ncbi:mitochondrial inner membrane protein required for protein import [Elasticomyces elasticus]|nr:mitochondrial inner membrane protein required for protein import [Elasticomyces elasticus]